MKRKIIILFLLITTTVLLAGCNVMPGYNIGSPSESGFFSGIWHGWIAPISLIFGIFDKDIRIYDFNNTGWLYDLGFYIAIIGGFGSFNFIRTKRKNRNNN